MDQKDRGDIVKRVPMFQGFRPEQLDRLLDAFEERSFEAGEYLFKESDSSTEMHILISGHLQIQTSTGSEIATISEMGIVGEMGVLTGHTRSATVLADQPSRCLCIQRRDLFRLMEDDKDIGYQVYRNVTHLLCERLRDNNILLEQQYLILEDLAEEG